VLANADKFDKFTTLLITFLCFYKKCWSVPRQSEHHFLGSKEERLQNELQAYLA